MNPIIQTIDQAIKDGVFPGAGLLVAKEGKIILNQVFGEAQVFPDKQKLTPLHYFDIASLTKPFSTATLFMVAHEKKLIELQSTLDKFFPSLKSSKITVKSLLNHTSGLPAWEPFYLTYLKNHTQPYNHADFKNWVIEQILAQKMIPSPSAVYSDLGYILLGSILENVTGQALSILFDEWIKKPLGLKSTFFNPLENKSIDNESLFAATENCPWRKKVLKGEVHDDHAWLMGGVAGHAGLFSTTEDIFSWLSSLNAARLGKKSIIQKETFDLFTNIPQTEKPENAFFTLGFDTPSKISSSGQYFSAQSLGHLGYTGTSFWWDLKKDIVVILLTNRVHPDRSNEKIKAFRPMLHDLILKTI